MRPTALLPSLFGFAALIGACGGEEICTLEERVAIRVHLDSPFGIRIERVTAERDHEMVCAFSSSPADAGTELTYRCAEQGEGTYTIRAYNGEHVWSTQVHVDANECHTTEIKDIDLLVDPAGADEDDRDDRMQEGQGR